MSRVQLSPMQCRASTCPRIAGTALAVFVALVFSLGTARLQASTTTAPPAVPTGGQTASNTNAENSSRAKPAPKAERRNQIEQRHIDEPEAEDGENVYRHSPMVHTLAHLFGISTEVTARIFEVTNFAILLAAILWFVLRLLPKTLRNRSERIQRELVEARSASEEARQRLDAVEQRLARLDEEIAAIQTQAEHETVAEEQRLQNVLEEEKRKIVQAAANEITAIGNNAQRELKILVAELVIEHAKRQISVSPETDRALVGDFVASLSRSRNGGGVN